MLFCYSALCQLLATSRYQLTPIFINRITRKIDHIIPEHASPTLIKLDIGKQPHKIRKRSVGRNISNILSHIVKDNPTVVEFHFQHKIRQRLKSLNSGDHGIPPIQEAGAFR